jgi:uncharacterized protein with GYD domain
MPKYLAHINYVGDGIKGVLKEGGTSRRDAAEAVIKSVGGTLEAMYFAFGDTDVYAIMDVPDNATMAGLALTITASGAVAVRTTVLLTAEEIDQAAKVSPKYRAPGA